MLTLIKLLLLGIFWLRTTELDRDEDSYQWKGLICLIASSIWWSKMVFWRHHSRELDLFFALCNRILQIPRLMSILCSPYQIEAALLWVTPSLGKRCACAHDTALSKLWGIVFKGFWKCLFPDKFLAFLPPCGVGKLSMHLYGNRDSATLGQMDMWTAAEEEDLKLCWRQRTPV